MNPLYINASHKRAYQTINTITNSVLFEAFFFMINIIHFKSRNKLLHERVNKLKFININTRTKIREDIKIKAEMTKEERAE